MIKRMRTTPARSRRRVVVDHRELALAIGGRIRAARLAGHLTQQQLAGDRYTKAYISALELGHAKPSMAALDYLAPRLGTTPDRLLANPTAHWTRLDADLCLAAGRFDEAAETYLDLAERTTDPVTRGELLLGAGEAYCRLRRPQKASGLLVEASRHLAAGGRVTDQRRAQYWMAYVHGALDDLEEARRVLHNLLNGDPADAEDPDFAVRVRLALARGESEYGSFDRARLYLEEAQVLAAGLDLRRRAIFYDVLARTRFGAGDVEGAIQAGTEALALFRVTEYEVEEASLENELAMSFLALGNLGRAEDLVAHALATAERLEHHAAIGHILDTQATIRLERGDASGALTLTERALAVEEEHGPPHEQLGARVTRARALAALGRTDEAAQAWADAGAIARTLSSPMRRKRVLSAWAEALAAQGLHAQAYEVMRETL
jgi:tetratricopeptide (TPR) repeat protein